MAERLTPIPLSFWRSASGSEPVREWLKDLPRGDQRSIGRDMAIVQFGWPIGLPLCRSMSDGLWELRAKLPGGRQARVFFGFYQDGLIALHAFIKKSQKTPREELALARKRWKELEAWEKRTRT